MGKETITEQTLDVKAVQTKSRGVDGLALSFADPFRLSQQAWREVLRFQVFSVNPVCIAMIDREGKQITIRPDEIARARNLDRREKRAFLDRLSFDLYEARSVMLGRKNH